MRESPQPTRALTRRYFSTACLIVAAFIVAALASTAAYADEDLAKRSQNPIGNLISVPFENNSDLRDGPEDGYVNVLNLKPVYPVSFGGFTLINRAIVPIVYQGQRVPGESSKSGLGNFTYQGFLSPANSGPLIWGIGPAITFPTRTDKRFGSQKWQAGPALVALAKPGPWLVGGLVQQTWSFAGRDRDPKVNVFSLQYFINYNLPWMYLTSTPTMTADWERSGGDRWLIPVGGGVGKLWRFGKAPIDTKVQAFHNVSKRDRGASWTLQVQVKLLFPK
jgi:hypothetical protein